MIIFVWLCTFILVLDLRTFWAHHLWVLNLNHFHPFLSPNNGYAPQLPLRFMVSSLFTVMFVHACMRTHTHIPFWVYLVLLLCVFVYRWPLNSLSGDSSLEKTNLPYLHSHWLFVTLHLGCDLVGVPLFMLACQLVLPLCWSYLGVKTSYCWAFMGAALCHIYRTVCLTADVLVWWLLQVPQPLFFSVP